ncbi:MAG: hypothetical protein QF473_33145, partial [Planctomycetota bacterium]|nr:hypothetical protein [Planctomycetota bacterium]
CMGVEQTQLNLHKSFFDLLLPDLRGSSQSGTYRPAPIVNQSAITRLGKSESQHSRKTETLHEVSCVRGARQHGSLNARFAEAIRFEDVSAASGVKSGDFGACVD